MGKRSDFERRPMDFYQTPPKAVLPLMRYFPASTTFVEPCAGDGKLVDAIESHNHICTFASDLVARRSDISVLDALSLTEVECIGADYIITNPPWSRDILHKLILHFIELRPTWLLFDADWMHTAQAKPYLRYCVAVISVGRVKWIEGSKQTGKDNCCWYLFDKNNNQPATFYGIEK